ncbi:MAG: hypothetical protein EOO43_07305 [Flavobacterium sp.]|nr:MAG: hypothetical protein EOO43_07305 [Flavobacterium sp.]
MPTREIIFSMMDDDPTIQPFYSNITSNELTLFLKSDGKAKKVFSTPESFKRFMETASQITTKKGKMDEVIKSTWFLLLDECIIR